MPKVTNDPKLKTIKFRITDDVDAFIRKEAKRKQVSISEILRESIELYRKQMRA